MKEILIRLDAYGSHGKPHLIRKIIMNIFLINLLIIVVDSLLEHNFCGNCASNKF